MRTVLENLLGNAWKFTAAPPLRSASRPPATPAWTPSWSATTAPASTCATRRTSSALPAPAFRPGVPGTGSARPPSPDRAPPRRRGVGRRRVGRGASLYFSIGQEHAAAGRQLNLRRGRQRLQDRPVRAASSGLPGARRTRARRQVAHGNHRGHRPGAVAPRGRLPPVGDRPPPRRPGAPPGDARSATISTRPVPPLHVDQHAGVLLGVWAAAARTPRRPAGGYRHHAAAAENRARPRPDLAPVGASDA